MAMNSSQAQSENDHTFNRADWTDADEASYRDWVESTLEGQMELEDLYWTARAAEFERGEDF